MKAANSNSLHSNFESAQTTPFESAHWRKRNAQICDFGPKWSFFT